MPRMLRDNRGMVLLLVLSAVALFMVLVVEFSAGQFADLEMAHNFSNSLQAQYLGEAGVDAAVSALTEDERSYDSEDADWEKFPEMLLMASSYLDGMTMMGKITDEWSKIDLNRLVKKKTDGTGYEVDDFHQKQLYRLMADVLAIDVSEAEIDELCQAVVDWLDEDDDPTPGGAESDYYLGEHKNADDPYEAKNGPFDTPEEILLVKGMNRDWFYGTKAYQGIRNFVTVNPNLNAEERINLNTVSKEVLMSLADAISEKNAQNLIDARPIKNDSDRQKAFASAGINTIDPQILAKIQELTSKYKGDRFRVDINGAMPSGSNLNVTAILKIKNKQAKIVYYRIY